MSSLKHLFEKNRQWVTNINAEDPEFFTQLSKVQNPEILWIGCSDSRVPATQIVDTIPGEIFVHRNVANQVIHTDLNCLSVLQFAVDVLKVKHVVVCGHFGCGGVMAALRHDRLGLIDNWLRHIVDICEKHKFQLDYFEELDAKARVLCEVNVIEQVQNLCFTTVVEDAWERGQELTLHGWIYHLSDGLLKDLEISLSESESVRSVYNSAIQRTFSTHLDDAGAL
jgi:carbonic anhydrase